jgi:hypothetical protein
MTAAATTESLQDKAWEQPVEVGGVNEAACQCLLPV